MVILARHQPLVLQQVEVVIHGSFEIDVSVPADMPIHLIMDNYATHKTDKVRAWLAARPRYKLHFTPTSASCLNLVERRERWANDFQRYF